ncbi:MAG: ADP-ribosylglycohydrolase family protein [Gammaproteobacteria bacterium]|jgi:ADP-ribosylglycohydrolase|nr:ADP-ribosylglycohydrolase family protein [Gammaproteobacteria bacterium]MDH3758590.1 ADP-ribosylglycohydrolase family protein [Gammaproteobacteria bacterium]MDH3846375.1 ADP-ribosylglycohydrolase family protein [Gammaproteobacteria bacterium]MDH3863219.1 ADP-ribosylglycohydrolase family protein [Gammaproteobacteria bacterium]MDH3904718.1 ADP-ribosylglycohydrolase family protein [Gammaproteobacteria bacterium]
MTRGHDKNFFGADTTVPARIRGAWEGRISGCLLGKPVEVLSFQQGREGLESYLREAAALPLRDYVPLIEGTLVDQLGRECCRGHICRAEPDDDINYTVLALLLLEDKGVELRTDDVARAWLRLLPAGTTWTAERHAYRVLLDNMADEFVNGEAPGFDLSLCSDSDYNEWIGAQIRADLYGWVCPGRPALAADLASRDAVLSHRGEGVHGAAFIAALAAVIPVSDDLVNATDIALRFIPQDSGAAAAVRFGRGLAGLQDAVDRLHAEYEGLSPVHTLNNLALVVWALCSSEDDFSAAIGNAVSAGWDTDCNGATVGGLFGLTGKPIPDSWTQPWQGRVGVSLAGYSELPLDDLVDRTVAVARTLQ